MAYVSYSRKQFPVNVSRHLIDTMGIEDTIVYETYDISKRSRIIKILHSPYLLQIIKMIAERHHNHDLSMALQFLSVWFVCVCVCVCVCECACCLGMMDSFELSLRVQGRFLSSSHLKGLNPLSHENSHLRKRVFLDEKKCPKWVPVAFLRP